MYRIIPCHQPPSPHLPCAPVADQKINQKVSKLWHQLDATFYRLYSVGWGGGREGVQLSLDMMSLNKLKYFSKLNCLNEFEVYFGWRVKTSLPLPLIQ